MGTRLDPQQTHPLSAHLSGQRTTTRPSAGFSDSAVTSLKHRHSLPLIGLVVKCPVARVTGAAVHFPWPQKHAPFAAHRGNLLAPDCVPGCGGRAFFAVFFPFFLLRFSLHPDRGEDFGRKTGPPPPRRPAPQTYRPTAGKN
ncbi:hypothetical protein MTO96_000279 [Rhipicephalus appendiculatus]